MTLGVLLIVDVILVALLDVVIVLPFVRWSRLRLSARRLGRLPSLTLSCAREPLPQEARSPDEVQKLLGEWHRIVGPQPVAAARQARLRQLGTAGTYRVHNCGKILHVDYERGELIVERDGRHGR